MGKNKLNKKQRKLRALKRFNKNKKNPRLLNADVEHPLQKHRRILVNFWKQFGYGLDKKRQQSYRTKEEVIAELIKIGEVVLTYKTKTALTPTQVRNEYSHHKSQLRGYNHFLLCFACGDKAQCRHHIIWIKNGGRNSRKNIIPLCNPCHAEIHPWLKVV